MRPDIESEATDGGLSSDSERKHLLSRRGKWDGGDAVIQRMFHRTDTKYRSVQQRNTLVLFVISW